MWLGSSQALKISKNCNFQKKSNCSSDYVKSSFERNSSQRSKHFFKKNRRKCLQKFPKFQVLQKLPQYTKIVVSTTCWHFPSNCTGNFRSESKIIQNKKTPNKKSAWKHSYGHLKRSFDSHAELFVLRFCSFFAQNSRTIEIWRSFQRELKSSIRRFRRRRRKQFWQKWRSFLNNVCSFFIILSNFPEKFSFEKSIP